MYKSSGYAQALVNFVWVFDSNPNGFLAGLAVVTERQDQSHAVHAVLFSASRIKKAHRVAWLSIWPVPLGGLRVCHEALRSWRLL